MGAFYCKLSKNILKYIKMDNGQTAFHISVHATMKYSGKSGTLLTGKDRIRTTNP